MRKCRIIIDTNLWISLLIGKRLLELRSLCNDDTIAVYYCAELKAEFIRIASSEKIRKYVTEERIVSTLELLENSCVEVSLTDIVAAPHLRDANDLYLLSLAHTVQADYLLTGDKDLLTLQFHNQTKIVTYNEFISI
ncbi:MAG: putative toxin-antitoxin system toxin component, PIN family [Bacteroidetes bacterium]|nr:putative toxin-antitoxin system toxin component, PIN family [Bacteroidota bacterium]